MIEAGEATFERDVIESSRQQPVLVDFWAPWCGPCRALGPLLERLEAEYGGRMRLVKVDSDQNPELSAQLRVRSIPYVIAFVDGAPVDAFVGAQPEREVRAFIDRLLPDPSEAERRKAAELVAAGRLADAAVALRAAVALQPAAVAARLDLAAVLLDLASDGAAAGAGLGEARAALDAVAPGDRAAARWVALDTRLRSLQRVAALPDRAALAARVAADGGDLAARVDLAQRLIAERDFGAALEQLLAVVAHDRRHGDDLGRRMMLSVFEMAAAADPALVADYRRRLAAVLNR